MPNFIRYFDEIIFDFPKVLKTTSFKIFFQVAIVYMSTRLFVNLGQVYIPLYLHETLSRNAESLAVVPLLMFISSLSATFIVHPLNKVLGRLVSAE